MPVVLMSGAQEREARLAGLDAGADDFLNKPIDPEELSTRCVADAAEAPD